VSWTWKGLAVNKYDEEWIKTVLGAIVGLLIMALVWWAYLSSGCGGSLVTLDPKTQQVKPLPPWELSD